MRRIQALVCLAALLALSGICRSQTAGPWSRRWTTVSETSAVVYWQLGDIKDSALSYVEYGKTPALGRRTPMTKEPRWAHFHRLTGLETGVPCCWRMVNVDPATKAETKSPIMTFTPRKKEGAVRIPDDLEGPPYVLDRPAATYVLTRDIAAEGTAIEIAAAEVTLDLDGHTVTFGDDTDKQVFGVQIRNEGKATVCNGHIVQGRRSGYYSSCVESRWRAQPTEVFGISTDVHLKCAYPIRFFGAARDVEVHHNSLYSRVTELESRHYPGNDLLRMDVRGGNVHVHDNLLTEGCHIGLRVAGSGPGVEVDHNDIRHHQQYVNGYAIAASCVRADFHHNKVTSSGRGVHLVNDGIRFHDNYFDIYGHQQLSDLPQKSRPFKHRILQLHGIKFEGRKVRNCKVYNNFVRIIQRQSIDSQGKGAPEDKISNGVYVRSTATALAADRLEDTTQDWEKDRWQNYWVKYDANRPSVRITGNDRDTLFADFDSRTPGEYTIYQKWQYVPASPLQMASLDPNAMNEVYGNVFMGLTTYRTPRYGGYGDSGYWASSIYFDSMPNGPADEGKYCMFIHDNAFFSNNIFVGSSASKQRPDNMTVRIERNSFHLADKPEPTTGHKPFHGISEYLVEGIKAGGNTFEGMAP